MTAATSKSEKSFFGAHFRNKLREHKQLGIVNIVLNILGLPLIACALLYGFYITERDIMGVDYDGFIYIGAFAVVLSIASGIIFALYSFRYLFSKSLVDMNYSLPLTSKQRFIADFLSGITVYIVPVIAGALLSLVIMGIGSAFIDTGDFWEVFGHLLVLGIILVIAMILYYTVCVFAVTCTGVTFDAIFAAVAVNIIIPITVVFIQSAVATFAFNTIYYESMLVNLLFNATSPAGVISFMVLYMESVSGYVAETSTASMFLRWLFPALIVIAAFIFATYLLYKKRKAESVSTPYVYKFFYYAIVTMAVFCIMASFIIHDMNILVGVVLCAIIYFIMEAVSKRGFKKLAGSFVRFGVTIVAVFAFCAIGKSTYGFGAAKYVPREAAVDSVSITMYGGRVDYSVSTDDEAVIEAATAMHKEIVNRIFNAEDYSFELTANNVSREDSKYSTYSENSVSITYYLNNGAVVMRHLRYSSDIADKLVTAIVLSDDYCEQLAEGYILNNIHANNDTYYASLDDITADTKAVIALENKLDMYVDTKTITGDRIIDFYNAYKTDLLAMTEEEFKAAPVYGYLDNVYSYYNKEFSIRESFLNTIAFLEEEGFRSCDITAETLEGAYNIYLGIYDDFEVLNTVQGMYENMIASGNDYLGSYINKTYKQEKFVSMLDYTYTNYSTVPAAELEFNEDLMTVIERATPIIVGEGAAGALYYEINGSNEVLFLPDTAENKELLERVYEAQFKDRAQYSDQW